jgi:hypothetical protein
VRTTCTTKAVIKKATKAAPTLTEVPEERNRSRAFGIFQTGMRTHTPGDHLLDRLRAERELRDRAVSLRT